MEGILMVLPAVVFRLVLFTMVAYIALAAADFAFQKFQHTKQLKMSKDEIKREFKESEGDPLIKGKRKQLHREILEDSTIQNTKKASVLVTNPTHRAVGIFYKKGTTSLPIITAKGADATARKMIEIARENDIPIMENVPLARGLYDSQEVHCYIGEEWLGPVAEVLRWVQDLDTIDLYEISQLREDTEGESDGWIKV